MPVAMGKKTTNVKANSSSKRSRIDLDESDSEVVIVNPSQPRDKLADVLRRVENMEKQLEKCLEANETNANAMTKMDEKINTSQENVVTRIAAKLDLVKGCVEKETEHNCKAWSETLKSIQAMEKMLEKSETKAEPDAEKVILQAQTLDNLHASIKTIDSSLTAIQESLKEMVCFFPICFNSNGKNDTQNAFCKTK